jgi:hypothetical protein
MSDACTILSVNIKLADIAEIIKNTKAAVNINGDIDNWDNITLKFANSELRFNKLVQERPGDKFSKMILGMHNYFRKIDTIALGNKDYVLECIGNANLAIGVAADPKFSEEDEHFDIIFAVAEALRGVVFNGSGMLNTQGKMLLDDDGSFDYEIDRM